ncbi:MAG: C40 family peptidase [Lachnospiraceae bacterium]|nr:C40 family peptidase [Lachnospiraceae bacterium]
MIKRLKVSFATVALASMLLTTGAQSTVMASPFSFFTKKTSVAKTGTKEADQAKDSEAADEKSTDKDDKNEEKDYTGLAVANIKKGEALNIRIAPESDASIKGRLKKGNMMKVIKKGDEWTKVRSGAVKGYVSNDYLVFDNDIKEYAEQNLSKYATIQTETLRVREKASQDSSILTLVDGEKAYKVKSLKNEDWTKIKTKDGVGYVSSDYVTIDYQFGVAKSMRQINAEAAARSGSSGSSSSSSNSSYGGGSVLGYASQFVGNPYRWGGSSLTGGADCSGFVMSVYRHFGVSLPHSSSAMRGVGRRVSVSEMRPGDIVCYSGHVGIYAGGGQLLSALGKKWGITYNSVHYKKIITVRRVL